MDNSILDQHEIYFSHLQSNIQEMKTYYQEKYWHQLTESVLQYIDDPQLNQQQHLIDFYNGFVKNFEKKIDQIKLMQIVMKVVSQFSTSEESLAFLDSVKERVLKDQQALFLYSLTKAFFYLNMGNQEEAQNLIKEVKQKLEKMNGVSSIIYSLLHKLCAIYHKRRNEHEQFYLESLQFLAYTPENQISNQDKKEISFEMAQAILIAKKIYNFSELLEQPVFQSLQNSEYEWIYLILQTFNKGNVQEFKNDMNKFASQIQSTPLLSQNLKTLDEKIRVMAFLELIFTLPKNDRIITFKQVANASQLNEDDVEYMIMRAMSLELIRGSIDQIAQLINVTWVIPRVLDRERITIMRDKVVSWNKALQGLLRNIEDQNEMVTQAH